MRCARTLIAVLASSSFVFTSHGLSSSMVLCVGSDGHVEVEVASSGCCASEAEWNGSSESEHDVVTAVEYDEDHCGQCVDFPVGMGHGDNCHPALQVQKIELMPPVSTSSLTFVDSAPSKYATHPVGSSETLVASTALCLRSVSLRI